MRPIVQSLASIRLREWSRRRGAAVVLALLVEALLVWMFFNLAPVFKGKPESKLSTFDISADRDDHAETPEKTKTKRTAQRSVQKPTQAPPPKAPQPQPTTAPDEPVTTNNFIKLTRNEFAASNIANAPRSPAGASSDTDSGGGASDAGDSEVAAGKGPHGETLYAAEWYRHPTHAELSTYIGDRARTSGWGLIACRTVARYHVEDCQELGESPRGSGLAGAVRQAAFQFLVRPPRVGGKSLVGAWVSIRIDYTIEREER